MWPKANEIGKSERFGYWLFGIAFVFGIAQLAVPWLAWVGWAVAIYGFMIAVGIAGEHGQKGCLFFVVLGYGLLFGFQFGLQYAKQNPEHWVALYMCSVALLGVSLTHFMAELARQEAEWERKWAPFDKMQEMREGWLQDKYAENAWLGLSEFDAETVDTGHAIAVAIEEDPADDDADNGHGRV